LRTREAELRAAGIRRLALFGSVARGEARPSSDIDLVAELDPAARMDLIRLVALEQELGDLAWARGADTDRADQEAAPAG
jgi:predicted nucleotidyltransferase